MTNLLRKCENCVFGNQPWYEDHTLKVESVYCIPVLPKWTEQTLFITNIIPAHRVANNAAENCKAFRLRETGVNE